MVKTCDSCGRKYSRGCGFSFFSFPKTDLLKNEWLKFCEFEVHPQNDTSKLKLCSAHFDQSCFQITRKDGPLILKPNAIPSIYASKRSQIIQPASYIKSFPFKDEDILQKWIQATDKKNCALSKNSKICGEHFSKEDYTCECSIAVDYTHDEFIMNEQRSPLQKLNIKTEDPMEGTSQQENTQLIEKSTQTTPPKSSLSPIEVKLKNKIRTLQKSIQRRKKKITTLSNLLRELKEVYKSSP